MASNAGFADLKLFLQPSFDASEYVRLLIHASGTDAQDDSATPVEAASRTDHKPEVDLSLAISRLNLAIDELSKSISDKVTANAGALLQRTSRIGAMRTGLADTREGIAALQKEVDSLQLKVHEPIVRLQAAQAELLRYDEAADVVARTAKFVAVARRLEAQMTVIFSAKAKPADKAGDEAEDDAVIGVVHGRDLARAALTIKEISTLLERENALFDAAHASTPPADETACSILDLDLVKRTLPAIESAQKTVTDYMEDMIVRGLRDLSPTMLSSSLQTAFNLGTLASLVKDLLYDLTEVVKERIGAAFDLDALSRSLGIRLPTLTPAYTTGYKSWSARGQDAADTHQQDAQWTAAFWKRLETLIVVEMGAVCSKVYTLEKVLKLKTDSETAVNFLDAALQVLDDKPSVTFWRTFGTSFRAQLDKALAKSPFLGQMLTATDAQGYLRLLRIFQAFFAKVAVYTDIVYDEARQSGETVELLRKTLGQLEQTHLDKSTLKLGQYLAQLQQLAGLGEVEAETVARLVTNLVDSHRFDPLLNKATLARVSDMLQDLLSRLRGRGQSQAFVTRLRADLSTVGITLDT